MELCTARAILRIQLSIINQSGYFLRRILQNPYCLGRKIWTLQRYFQGADLRNGPIQVILHVFLGTQTLRSLRIGRLPANHRQENNNNQNDGRHQ